MTTLYCDYTHNSTRQEQPTWMREERYMYCEQTTRTSCGIWARIKKFFL